MKRLGKVKLNNYREMNDFEMKSILGGEDAYVTCSLNVKGTACSDTCKGKACKTSLGYAGTCAFTDYYGQKSNTCECLRL